MADKNNNTLAIGLVVIGGAALLYALMSSSNQQVVSLPQGATYQGFTNNTGAAVYVTAAGQIINALGQIIGDIASMVPGQYTTEQQNSGQPGVFGADGWHLPEGGLM